MMKNLTPAYKTLKHEYPDVMFWHQSYSLFHDINRIVRASVNDYVCFFVDDCICFNKVEIPELIFDDLAMYCCISLRLGLNISERGHNLMMYPDNVSSYALTLDKKHMVWNKNRTLLRFLLVLFALCRRTHL